jgi:hypothetical protein
MLLLMPAQVTVIPVVAKADTLKTRLSLWWLNHISTLIHVSLMCLRR